MKLYSDVALSHRNNSGDADVISDIACPWMWVLLASLTICLAAVIYWSFLGTLVDSVSGSGVLIRAGGARLISARQSGTLEYLDIQPGTPVVSNQVIGRIYNPQIFFDIRKLRIAQAELQERISKIQKGMDNLAQRRTSVEEEKTKIIVRVLEELGKSRSRISELVSMQHKLMSVGASSKVDYYNAINRSVEHENSVATTLIQKIEMLYSQREAQWNLEEKNITLRGELFTKQQELELALKVNEDSTWLRSEVNGVVTEVFKRPGDPVSVGSQIAVVSEGDSEKNIRLVAFVSTEEGKKIRAGMSAYFSPTALRAADYGYIMGIVLSTSMFPVSAESINAELKKDDYVKSLVNRGSVMRIEVEALPDDRSANGLKWTSKNGMKTTIDAGMVGSLLVNTEYRRPISYIIPYLRENFFGISKKNDKL